VQNPELYQDVSFGDTVFFFSRSLAAICCLSGKKAESVREFLLAVVC
jgi:hypothetical protein